MVYKGRRERGDIYSRTIVHRCLTDGISSNSMLLSERCRRKWKLTEIPGAELLSKRHFEYWITDRSTRYRLLTVSSKPTAQSLLNDSRPTAWKGTDGLLVVTLG